MKRHKRRALLALLRLNKHAKFVYGLDVTDHDTSIPGSPDVASVIHTLFSSEYASVAMEIFSTLNKLGEASQRPRNRPLLPF